jgi:hypothetical protein
MGGNNQCYSAKARDQMATSPPPPHDRAQDSTQPGTPENKAVDDAEKQMSAEEDMANDGFERPYVTGVAKWLILGPVTLTYFTYFLDLAVLSTATPAITSEFNSLVDIAWYGGAYQLGSAAFQPLTGKFYRYFARHQVDFPSLLRRLPGRLGPPPCGAASSSAMFIARLANGALTIISAILPPREQAAAMSINMGLG